MPYIENINSLRKKLERLSDKYSSGEDTSVVVGYTANYAVRVHERPAKHAPGKQHKFLEQPARQLGGELSSIIRRSLQGGVKLLQSLYLAGLRLQRESQLIVPVDTGNLRGSAFTAKESDLLSVIAVNEGRLLEKLQKQSEQWAKKTDKQKSNYRKRRRNKVKKYKRS